MGKNFSTIELFAGCGGTALGFEQAGLTHSLMVENNKDCINTLQYNFKDSHVLSKDIRDVSFLSYCGNVDVVQAGFPCQGFSHAGKKLGFAEARGSLFFEFARCVKETQPKIAVGENVKGLVNHDKGRTLRVICDTFDEIGYRVTYKVLRSQYLDVPQKRERLIILAIRKDLAGIPFLFPEEKNYIITLKEALANCPVSEGVKYSPEKQVILELVPPGGCWRDLPADLQKSYMGANFYHTGGRTGIARRLSWNEPCLTLLCSPAQKQTERCHPSETRPFTIREYARIQTFPDEWRFSGGLLAQYRQIGNAVPVKLGYHIGKKVIEMLEKIGDLAN